jgi:hypothetical protein
MAQRGIARRPPLFEAEYITSSSGRIYFLYIFGKIALGSIGDECGQCQPIEFEGAIAGAVGAGDDDLPAFLHEASALARAAAALSRKVVSASASLDASKMKVMTEFSELALTGWSKFCSTVDRHVGAGRIGRQRAISQRPELIIRSGILPTLACRPIRRPAVSENRLASTSRPSLSFCGVSPNTRTRVPRFGKPPRSTECALRNGRPSP